MLNNVESLLSTKLYALKGIEIGIMKKTIKKPVNISVITNITIEPYFTKEINKLLGNECNISINYIVVEDYTNKADIIKIADIILIWININILFPNMYSRFINSSLKYETAIESVTNLYIGLINFIKELGNKKIIVISQENNDNKVELFLGNIISRNDIVRFIDNEVVKAISSSATIIDINKVMLSVGISNSYDNVNKYRWNAVYSKELIENMAAEVYKQYKICQGATKKCIILDCDNVLWGGIVSEDGTENIKLNDIGEGLFYQDFQRFVLNLYYHGIILAISSKNEYDDIINIFNEHNGMILKTEHISCFQVNWDNKANNILRIANFLNIGLDSIIFVDDSLFEINLINEILPDVTTILFDKSENIYSKFDCINLPDKVESETINHRTATYQSNNKRNLLLEQSVDYNEYLISLNTNIDIRQISDMELNRVSELSQRTNQCTNGIRFTTNDLLSIKRDPNYDLYSVYVEDIFGPLGLVGAMIIEKNEGTLVLFCLSCRALGRNIEHRMIAYINNKYNIEKIMFADTNKNKNHVIKKHLSEKLLINID